MRGKGGGKEEGERGGDGGKERRGARKSRKRSRKKRLLESKSSVVGPGRVAQAAARKAAMEALKTQALETAPSWQPRVQLNLASLPGRRFLRNKGEARCLTSVWYSRLKRMGSWKSSCTVAHWNFRRRAS
jgi:hypothetical protein